MNLHRPQLPDHRLRRCVWQNAATHQKTVVQGKRKGRAVPKFLQIIYIFFKFTIALYYFVCFNNTIKK